MKRLILLITFCSIYGTVLSQENFKEKSYRAITGYKINSAGNSIERTNDKNWQTIIVIAESEGQVYYRYAGSTEILEMSKEEFEKIPVIRTYRQFKDVKVGIYTVPFRFRGIGRETFDFESTLSLATNLIFGFGSAYKQESRSDVSIGIGLSAINLDNTNSLATDSRTASALTLSLGYVHKFNEFVNIGVFTGLDFLGKADRKLKWDYDQQAWIGVGININFNELKNDVREGDKISKLSTSGKTIEQKK